MGAPALSLGNLLGCAEALKEATKGHFSKGIKAAMKAMENVRLDFKATIDRVAEASKWKEETIEDWISRGEAACANLIEKAAEVLKEADVREEAEARVRIMDQQGFGVKQLQGHRGGSPRGVADRGRGARGCSRRRASRRRRRRGLTA
jgi:hypothetical protein